MIEKIKQFQENLKKNQKISDIELNLNDCFKNFCLDSFIQHIFSKLIILIQICFIARVFSENLGKESFLLNNVILFAVGFSTWKLFSVFFEYLNEFSLLKFLKAMNKKDYFSLGVIYRKIILLSLFYLIVFYVPFIYVIKSTLNNQLLSKSLEIEDVYVKYKNLSFSEKFNYTLKFQNKAYFKPNETEDYYYKNKNFNVYNHIQTEHSDNIKKSDIKDFKDFPNIKEKKLFMYKIEEINDKTNNHEKSNKDSVTTEIKSYSIEENINNLLHFQYLYFFVLLIRIFNKPIQNIFFVFKYNKYLNFMMATKFKINFSMILFCFKNQFSLLNSIFLADLVSEIFVFTYLIIVLTLYNPFPQVSIVPSLGIFNIDKTLLLKILKLKKIMKFFFLNFWNDFIFLIFIYIKVYTFNEHQKFQISINIQIDKESNGTDLPNADFPIGLDNFNKEISNWKVNTSNFFLFIILKEFFFNLSKYTKRNYYRILLDNIQMISLIKVRNEEEKNNGNIKDFQNQQQNDFHNFEKTNAINDYKKPLLENNHKINNKASDNHSLSIADKKTSKITSEFNNNLSNHIALQQERDKAKISNNKQKTLINNLNNNKNNNNNQNILVVIKNKIYVSLILSCFVFVIILIWHLIGIFSFLNPASANTDETNYFKINYAFLLILLICGSINYLATELFIINDFLDNQNDDKIIIYGFCLFSLLPFLVFVFFISSSGFFFIVINLVNVYFIYTFYDFLSNIDLRFKKIELLINKEMFEI